MAQICSITFDTRPAPAIRSLQFQDPAAPVPVSAPLGDSNAIMVITGDGTCLALRYMQTGELLRLLRQQRLLPDLLRLRERSPWAYLLLDGTFVPGKNGRVLSSGVMTGFAWGSVQGALLSIQELGVGLITLQDTQHLADAITFVARRDRTPMRLHTPRDGVFMTPAEELLQALPGIGDERCQALLRYAGSAARALDLLTDPERSIPSIGDTIKADVRRALGLAEGRRLAVVAIGRGEDPAREFPVQGVSDGHSHGRTDDGTRHST